MARNVTTPMSANFVYRTSGRSFSSSGVGRTMPVELHVLPCSMARDTFSRCAKSASRMTPRKATVIDDAFFVFQKTTCSMIPRPTPAAKARGNDSMPATTAAAIAGNSNEEMLPKAVEVDPAKGALRMNVSPASPPATTHTIVDNLLMGMPYSSARSALSAAARTAMPTSVRSMNHARPRMIGGTETRIARWFPLNVTGWISKLNEIGVSKPPTIPADPNHVGM